MAFLQADEAREARRRLDRGEARYVEAERGKASGRPFDPGGRPERGTRGPQPPSKTATGKARRTGHARVSRRSVEAGPPLSFGVGLEACVSHPREERLAPLVKLGIEESTRHWVRDTLRTTEAIGE